MAETQWDAVQLLGGFYENKASNTPVDGASSLTACMPIGTIKYPKVAKRRGKMDNDLPQLLSFQAAKACTSMISGQLTNLIPVFFINSSTIDGGITDIMLVSSRKKIGFNTCVDGKIIMYSSLFKNVASTSLYHVPLLMLMCAYLNPKAYSDVMDAVDSLLDSIQLSNGWNPTNPNQMTSLVLLSDELMYAYMFGPNNLPSNSTNKFKHSITMVGTEPPSTIQIATPDIPPNAFKVYSEFVKVRKDREKAEVSSKKISKAKFKKRVIVDTEFVGKLPNKLAETIMLGLHSLLTGPTETGKTLCVESVCAKLGAPLTTIRGTEGLKDRDLLGALKLIDGESVFIKGPLPIAMELGRKQYELQLEENKKVKGKKSKKEPIRVPPSVLYIDEINRLDTRHQNLILVSANVTYASKCYTVYIPELAEEITCPDGYFAMVAARNFGSNYAGTNDMDIACVRRFHRKFDVRYLDRPEETALLIDTTGIEPYLAEILARTAVDIRSQSSELEAPLGTGSLIEWSKHIKYMEECGKTVDVKLLLETAKDCWMELVTGRNTWGEIDQYKLEIVENNIRRSYSEVVKR